MDIGGTPDTKPARVKDITLTKTILLDPQGKLVIVPNSVIVSSKVINYTKAGFFEVPLRLTISLDEDIRRVKNDHPRSRGQGPVSYFPMFRARRRRRSPD